MRGLLAQPTMIYSPFCHGREEIGVDFSLRRWPPWRRWLRCPLRFGVLTPCTLPLRIVLTMNWSRIRHLWLKRIARDSHRTQRVILRDDGIHYSTYKTYRYQQKYEPQRARKPPTYHHINSGKVHGQRGEIGEDIQQSTGRFCLLT